MLGVYLDSADVFTFKDVLMCEARELGQPKVTLQTPRHSADRQRPR
jgi:hypothetical protein